MDVSWINRKKKCDWERDLYKSFSKTTSTHKVWEIPRIFGSQTGTIMFRRDCHMEPYKVLICPTHPSMSWKLTFTFLAEPSNSKERREGKNDD